MSGPPGVDSAKATGRPGRMDVLASQEDQLARLLGGAIAALDISDADFLAAEARYHEVAGFLCGYWADARAAGAVYPQGSMRLGTVTRLFHRNDDYDLDLVCRRDLLKESITQAGLKADVGHCLELFVKSEPEGSPELDDEGKRCWTLAYPGYDFHLGVLPALPDLQAEPNGILLTDTDLRNWQYSNPADYADWFHDTMRQEWLDKASRVAASNGMDVADLPAWSVKTALQRTVQALKRHREIYFAEDLHNRTASIIITTLAAQAYAGEGGLYEVLADITAKMPALVQYVNGIYTVCNPVQENENFADRWQKHPERAERFFQWMEQARADVIDLGTDRGVGRILEKTAATLGRRAADGAEAAFGGGLRDSRRTGQLGMLPGAATLVTGAGLTVPDHHFPVIPRTPRGLSLPQQALGLRSCFPTAETTLRPTVLTWIGVIRPTPCSSDYTIKITYRYASFPDVVAVTTLEPRRGEYLPHTYCYGSLCLHEAHEWTPAMAIAATTVPWTAEWLAHNELWKVRGRWHGDDPQDQAISPVPIPAEGSRNRADRRRAGRPRHRPPLDRPGPQRRS